MRRTVIFLFALLLVLPASAQRKRPELTAADVSPVVNNTIGNCNTMIPDDCSPIPAGDPVPFTGDDGPMRVRRSIFDAMNDFYWMQKYEKAIAALRNLPFDDPRSWCRQANVHCFNCSGGGSTVEVHLNYQFLPWHRAYLYFYEKILGELINDPTFALPYWDWNSASTPDCKAHFQLPPPYANPASSLYDKNREPRTPAEQMRARLVGGGRVNGIIIDNPTQLDFAGGPINNSEDSALWPGPHGVVHNYVGLAKSPNNDMGSLAAAARDPIFFAHHANIDRIWDVWWNYYGKPAYTSDFLSQSFTFYDEKKQWVEIKASDVFDPALLHFRYEPPSKCSVPLPSSAAAADSRLFVEPRTMPAEIRHRERVPAAAAAPKSMFEGKRVVLHVDDVKVSEQKDAAVAIFVNMPDANASTSLDDPHFVDFFTIVSHGNPAHEEHTNRDFTFRLDANHLKIIEDAGGTVNVTLVPVSTTEGAPNAKDAPARLQISHDPPYVTVEDEKM
ncbi:MAG TPA: tyrosinase family protein [Thermoanaerobaculia bacterium]|nr:tyrosinase family protein [Thermoanaerobaculia bacterium]